MTMGRGKRILLVEDNPDHAALTLRALRKGGVDVDTVVARNAVEALELLAAPEHYPGGGLPTMVLLDLKLPGMGGVELLRRLRQDRRTRLLPVIVLTSSREESDLVTCYGSGANSYIRKPVDFQRFAETVRQLGHYWLDLNEPAPAEA